MKANKMKCRLCGQDMFEASERGAFLKRVNETGIDGIWECSPSCDRKHGNPDDALLAALEDNHE